MQRNEFCGTAAQLQSCCELSRPGGCRWSLSPLGFATLFRALTPNQCRSILGDAFVVGASVANRRSSDMSPIRGRRLRQLVGVTGLPASKVALRIGAHQSRLVRAMSLHGRDRIPKECVKQLLTLAQASVFEVLYTLKQESDDHGSPTPQTSSRRGGVGGL